MGQKTGRKSPRKRNSVRSRRAGKKLLYALRLLRRRSKTADPSVAPTASTVYGEYIKDELARQDVRQSSFEQRGIAVITTAGTLVTLLFGLAALSTSSAKGNPLHHEESAWLAVALVLFFIAAILALATNFPIGYKGPGTPDPKKPDEPSIATLLNATPENSPADAIFAVADVRLTILTSAQKKNGLKGKFLFAALLAEVFAVVCVAVAIFELITT
jgi:hypothetical protein